ncbi:MAG: fumarylacetoacetate hydrolase family protein, partial [Rhodospirillaceae bacterium]|nr:fumarylacetoacetate hydrolase family protein [Rhodospirillaceae bacterium]
MKLGTLKDGTRDGTLVVVSRDLKTAVKAEGIAPTLQAVLDDWAGKCAPLEALYNGLNDGKVPVGAFPFDPAKAAAPLPRAYQWVDGSAYLIHAERVRRSRGAELPKSAYEDPLMYQGSSDTMLGPRDDIVMSDEAWGIDFEGEIVAITDDVPMGASAEQSAGRIRLLTIVNDVSLRGLIPAELAKGFGFLHGKPSTAFAPVMVTPDELGPHWRDGTIHLPLVSTLNGKVVGRPNAGEDIHFTLPQLIAHAAKTRALSAGTIVGSGTVANRDESRGCSCIAEIRAIETIKAGKPATPFMHFGDTIRIEMKGTDGMSVFGAIQQRVAPL